MGDCFDDSNANVSQRGPERRRQRRYQTVHIQGSAAKQQAPTPGALSAELIDISDGGIGVEMSSPLEVGSLVSVAGELHSTRFCVGLRGYVRVAHCREHAGGLFRMGLAFHGAKCRNVSCNHKVATSPKLSSIGSQAQYLVLGPNGSKTCVPLEIWGNLRVIVPQRRPAALLVQQGTTGTDASRSGANAPSLDPALLA